MAHPCPKLSDRTESLPVQTNRLIDQLKTPRPGGRSSRIVSAMRARCDLLLAGWTVTIRLVRACCIGVLKCTCQHFQRAPVRNEFVERMLLREPFAKPLQ